MPTTTDLLDDMIDNLIQIADTLTHEGNYSQRVRDLLFDAQLTLHRAEHPRWREVCDAYHDLNNHNPYND